MNIREQETLREERRKNLNKTQLPPLDHEMGYTAETLKEFFGDRYPKFEEWMAGQTGAIDERGRFIVYWWDVERFMEGRPVLD